MKCAFWKCSCNHIDRKWWFFKNQDNIFWYSCLSFAKKKTEMINILIWKKKNCIIKFVLLNCPELSLWLLVLDNCAAFIFRRSIFTFFLWGCIAILWVSSSNSPLLFFLLDSSNILKSPKNKKTYSKIGIELIHLDSIFC